MILNNRKARLWNIALAFQGYDMSLSYLPWFVAKASSERHPLPHFLFVQSLEAFVAILLEDHGLYPAWAIHIYLDLPASFRFVLMSLSCFLLV